MSWTTSTSYEIGRPGERCAATGREFTPGEPFIAALVEREPDAPLERLDYSIEAWEDGARPKGLFAHWRGTVARPDEKPKPLLDHGSLASLFDQLEAAEEPRQQAFRYVLALILSRKRHLQILEATESKGGQPGRLLVRRRGDGPELPPMEVVDPGMDEATIAEVIEQLEPLMRVDS